MKDNISATLMRNGEVFSFPASFKIRPRAITRLLNGDKLTRRMSERIYKKYVLSNEWREKKNKYKKDKCEICGYEKMLALHHLTYKNLLFESNNDLTTLCNFCHCACHIEVLGKGKLRNPSSAAAKIINRLRDGKKLKPSAFSIFLRRRYIARHGLETLPDFNFFQQFFYQNIKGKEYPFGYSITSL